MNELIKRRKRLTELEVQCYLMQILSSIKYLHDHKVIHRDLKLGNLFLSDKMEIKLGDFGLATKLEYEGERKRTICGTPNYIAPEILEAKETGHSFEVDVWSLGVIAYTLLIGKPPFETNDVKSTYKKIRTNDYCFPDQIVISSAAKNMIKKILHTDPIKRPTINDLFNDEFFKTSGSIPKLLPISTLACPPSASYIRQFLPQSSSVSKQPNYQVGRTSSPKRFENTTPINNNNAFGASASQTTYNPSNIKSQQQMGLKEKKDFINTYRTGGAQTSSSSGLGNSQYGQKNFDTHNVNNQKIDNFLQGNKIPSQKIDSYPSGSLSKDQPVYQKSTSLNPPQIEGYPSNLGQINFTKSTSMNNQQVDSYSNINNHKIDEYSQKGYQQSTSLNHQKSDEYGKNTTNSTCQKTQSIANYGQSSTCILNGVQSLSNVNTNKNTNGSTSISNFAVSQSTAFSNINAVSGANLNNLSGGGSTANQNYNSSSKNYPSSTQTGTSSALNRNSIEKYSSSSNINSNGNPNYIRAKSEKMHTQPTSSLLQAYGFMRQDQQPTSGTTALAYNNSSSNIQVTQPGDIQLQGPTIWVQKWVDYSSKYGLGYLLCNGQAGVFFNDSTKIILNTKSESFDYIERNQHDKQDIGRTFSLQEYPEDIQKKVTLLQHFRSFLEGEDKTVKVSVQVPPQDMSEQNKSSKIYVKKWLRTKHAILFRLSNKVVQVIFQDSTEIILSSELRAVTYVNKKQERVTYPLTSAMESSNQEMSKRLRYTKDILTHMLGNGQSNKNGQQGGEILQDVNPLSTGTNPLRTANMNIDSKEKSHSKTSSINVNSCSAANLAPTTSYNNNNSSSQIQPSQKPSTRENLHYSKNGAITSIPSSSTNQQTSQPNPVAYNNYTQNENINVMLFNKGQQQIQQQAKSSINGYELNGFASNSANKKEGLTTNTNITNSNNNLSIGQPSNIQNLLKSNSTIGRMNSMNPTATSSLSNLNNFNNYVMSSRKTEV